MLVKLDLQHVTDTGVADSMQDMIVCLIGALLAPPFILRCGKGWIGFLTRPVYAFQTINLNGRRD